MVLPGITGFIAPRQALFRATEKKETFSDFWVVTTAQERSNLPGK
jgi:hypothetical protein